MKTLDEMYYAGLLNEGMTEEEKQKTLSAQFNHILRSLTAKSTHIISKLMEKEREKELNIQELKSDRELTHQPPQVNKNADSPGILAECIGKKSASSSITGKVK